MNEVAKRRLVMVVDEGGNSASPSPPLFSFLSFPDDIVAYLGCFLPLQLQAMMAIFFPSLAAALWSATTSLDIFPDELGKSIKAVTKYIPMCRDLKHIVFNLTKLAPFTEVLILGPLYQAFASMRKLTRLEIHALVDGASLFYTLVAHVPKLQYGASTVKPPPEAVTQPHDHYHNRTVVISCSNFPTKCLGEAMLNTKQVLADLTYLRITIHLNDRYIDGFGFMSALSAVAPNLTTFYGPLEHIDSAKQLLKLTHLYISSPPIMMPHPFGFDSHQDVENNMKRIIDSTPPLVGPHLLLQTSGYYTTILEHILESYRTLQLKEEFADIIIRKYGYRLDFVHEIEPQAKVGVLMSIIDACVWNWSTFRMLLCKFNPPLVFTSGGDDFYLFYDITLQILRWNVPDTQKCEILRDLLGAPLDRAIAAGYKPGELVPTVDRRNKRKLHAIATLLKYASKETVKVLLSRPDVFGDVRTARTEKGHTLLGLFGVFVDELLAAGVDWRNVGHDGINDLEWSAFSADYECIKKILAVVPDEEFGRLLTPTVCVGVGDLSFADRMLRLVPAERWGPCINAVMHSTLVRRKKPAFVEDPLIAQLQADAWFAPINWDLMIEMFHFTFDHRVHSTPMELALLLDDDYADSVAVEMEKTLGPHKAQVYRDVLASAREKEKKRKPCKCRLVIKDIN